MSEYKLFREDEAVDCEPLANVVEEEE